jgi:hypothetical protein
MTNNLLPRLIATGVLAAGFSVFAAGLTAASGVLPL